MRNLGILFKIMGVLCVIAALFCGAWFVNQQETVGDRVVAFMSWSVGGGIVCMFFFAIAYHLEAMADIRDILCADNKPQAEHRPIADKPNDSQNRSTLHDVYIACPRCGLKQRQIRPNCVKCGAKLSNASESANKKVDS